jgi:hypothetical protein
MLPPPDLVFGAEIILHGSPDNGEGASTLKHGEFPHCQRADLRIPVPLVILEEEVRQPGRRMNNASEKSIVVTQGVWLRPTWTGGSGAN